MNTPVLSRSPFLACTMIELTSVCHMGLLDQPSSTPHTMECDVRVKLEYLVIYYLYNHCASPYYRPVNLTVVHTGSHIIKLAKRAYCSQLVFVSVCVSACPWWCNTWIHGGGSGRWSGWWPLSQLRALGDHTWGPHLGTTLGEHTWGTHLETTLWDDTLGRHFGTTLADDTCGPHLADQILGDNIWGPHLATTFGDIMMCY